MKGYHNHLDKLVLTSLCGCIYTMGRVKERATKRKTTLPFQPLAGGPQRKIMGGEDWPSLDVDLLRHPEGSPSQRVLTLVSKRTETSWSQKRDKAFQGETSITALTTFGMGQMQKKNNWSQQKTIRELLWESDRATFLSTFFFLLLRSIGNPWRPAKSASCAPHLSAYT